MAERSEPAYRRIPAVGALLEHAAARALLEAHPRARVTSALRDMLGKRREAMDRDPGAAAGLEPEAILAEAADRLAREARPGLRRVVNASGVILHTGLGRAVLAEEALEALRREAATYCSLAVDLRTGERTFRERCVADLVRELTGAEAATVVNNNAAATLLALSATCAGREAVVSRGQLVEIGGSFRLPDVMAQSGAIMVEVGTTNQTHLEDYRRAITERTGLLLRVHTSNYKVVGFASEVPLEELTALGRERGIPVLDDLGAGALVDLRALGFPEEPVVSESLRAGSALVTMSADKLIGGPQGGIVLGRADLVARIRRHPLFRCVRVGKLELVALEATLRLFRDPVSLLRRHPTLRMMTLPLDEIAPRAERLREALRRVVREDVEVGVQDGISRVGSGALPVHGLGTRLVTLRDPRAAAGEVSRRLRERDVPVIARVLCESILLDPRTLQEGDEEPLLAACAEVLGEAPAR